MTKGCAALHRAHGCMVQPASVTVAISQRQEGLTAPHDGCALDAQAGVQGQVAVHVRENGEVVAVVPLEARCHPLGLI